MRYDPQRHHRRSIRLTGHDYAQAGPYFVTICTQDRTCWFGEVADGVMHLSEAGRVAAAIWSDLPARFPGVATDAYVVMPNHIHGIIRIDDDAAEEGAINRAPTNDGPNPVGAPFIAPDIAPGIVPMDPHPDARVGAINRAPTNDAPNPVGAQFIAYDIPPGIVPRDARPDARVGAINRAPTNDGPNPVEAPFIAPHIAAHVAPDIAPDVAPHIVPTHAPTLGAVVRAFKAVSARTIRQTLAPRFAWQRNYYEHIIRDEESLNRVCQYIAENLARWPFDRENPAARA